MGKDNSSHCSKGSMPLSFPILSSLLQSALGWDYKSELSQHGSQTDAAKGFGGRYGVQKDRQDRSAGGYDDMEEVKPAQRTAPSERMYCCIREQEGEAGVIIFVLYAKDE